MALPGGVRPYPMEAQVPGAFSEEKIGAAQGNIERAAAYLRDRGGRWTMHTAMAWHVAPAVHDRLLDPETAVRERCDAAQDTGSLLSSAMVVARVPWMPQTAAVREISARLLDPQQFTPGKQAGIRLYKPALAMGDLAKARSLWESAVAAGATPDGAKPDALPPRDRAVTGALDLPGARIALYRQTDAKPPKDVPGAQQLVAAAVAHGKFAFTDLPAGFYLLAILLPEGADPARVKVEGALGPFDLTRQRRAEVGALRIAAR